MKNYKSSLPSSRSYQRKPVRAINCFLRIINALGIGRIRLDEDYLIETAKKQTGCKDFGTDPFMNGFRVVLQAIENDADLNPLGRFIMQQSILRILKHRLWAEDLYKKHPEIADQVIETPLVINGMARSGTTRMHRLLACDPYYQHIKAWESWNPVPRPDCFGANPDPRIKETSRGLDFIFYITPQMKILHPLVAGEPEEELGLLQHSFSSQIWEVANWMPSMARWVEDNDQTYAYRYMVKLMKIIQWFRKSSGPWILKSPNHMQHLNELLTIFPDAKIVYTHRDPVKIVGSLSSLAWSVLVRDTDHVNPYAVGKEWFYKTDVMISRNEKAKENLSKDQYLDTLFSDVNRDAIGVVKKVYEFIGRELQPETEETMLHWLKENYQHKHGVHQYRLKDFGLVTEEVEEHFSWYRGKYGIPYEYRNRFGKEKVTA